MIALESLIKNALGREIRALPEASEAWRGKAGRGAAGRGWAWRGMAGGAE